MELTAFEVFGEVSGRPFYQWRDKCDRRILHSDFRTFMAHISQERKISVYSAYIRSIFVQKDIHSDQYPLLG